MKTNVDTHGGQLAAAYEDAYARYLVRAVAEFRAAGAPAIALTVVNEPKASPGYSPSMAMSADQGGPAGRDVAAAPARRGRAALGGGPCLRPQLGRHDVPDRGAEGPDAGAFAGAAFHCYGGDESARSRVAAAAPGKQVWTTECSGGTWSPDFPTNLRWNARHMLVGAFRNLSTASLWFNLALDPSGGPTNGGCTTCRGLLTIDPAAGAVTRNVEYWLVAQFGRRVRPGAVRVDSTASNPTGVQSVAFVDPDGSHALVLYNEGGSAQPVTVRWAGKVARVRAAAGAVATLHW